jgi:hypothetical protein
VPTAGALGDPLTTHGRHGPGHAEPMKPSRPMPYPGMPVRVVHLGAVEPAVIDEVHDGGQTLVVGEERFTLRRVNGRFVREGEPPYGTRLSFERE